jgi:adenosylcobinamide-GDP ribazoletransferase
VKLWAAWRGAVAFLTRLPVGHGSIDPRALSWSPALFPLVGALLGAGTWGVQRISAPLGNAVAATFATAFAVLVTGAFHEDGLADSADGLLGATSRERAIAIMRDSRIGTYGAGALMLVLMARVGLLARIGAHSPLPLVLCASLARVGPVWLMGLVPHADPTHAKHGDFVTLRRSRAWVATGLQLGACAGLLWLEPGALRAIGLAWLVALSIALYVARLARRRLGGITGDLLGAAEQLGEVGILTVCAIGLRG